VDITSGGVLSCVFKRFARFVDDEKEAKPKRLSDRSSGVLNAGDYLTC
jgi:hypothetical protein